MQACRVLCNAAIRINTCPLPARCASSAVDPGVFANAAGDFKHVSILLQKTLSLLPRTLSTADGTSGPESSHFWSNMLQASITELNHGSDQVPSKATIAVCGFDKSAGSRDLVTALLEDPFSSDPVCADILRHRWKNAPRCVNIQYGKPSALAGELSTPSDWLRRFPYAIKLTELPDLPSINSETDSLLLNSDILLLLSDPIVTPLSGLVVQARHLLDRPNTILVLTSGSVSDSRCRFVSQTLSKMGCKPGYVLFVDPQQALDAVAALQTDPTSPSAIDKYQKDTLGSRISCITAAINNILGPENLSMASLVHLRQKTALSKVHGSLAASHHSVGAMKKDVELMASKVDSLSSKVQRLRENARQDVLGEPGENNVIEKALFSSAKEMSSLLESLTFWKMVWRVDEIGALVSATLQRQWCQGLENQLTLYTGRLESTKRELSVSAFSLVSAPSASLRSPVLENQLQQLTRVPTLTLTPDSLTQPIHRRRSQLIQYTTTKLHREAQSAVVGALSGMLGGAGLGWWLAFGEHILNLGPGTEMGTAMGSGALLAVGGVRWAVGKWEQAKQRWAQDSARIGQGLARDLQDTVQRTVDDNVTIVAWTACKGMQDMVGKRREEVHQLHSELCDLDTELDAFHVTRTGQGLPSGGEAKRK